MIDWSRYPNFTEAEFRCRCGCGRAGMDPAFMDALQDLRRLWGKPMVISSGYRCPEHNAAVSSTGPSGPHTTGKAADILVHGGMALSLLALATNGRFTGVGVHQRGPHAGRFIHLDTIEGPARPGIWSY